MRPLISKLSPGLTGFLIAGWRGGTPHVLVLLLPMPKELPAALDVAVGAELFGTHTILIFLNGGCCCLFCFVRGSEVDFDLRMHLVGGGVGESSWGGGVGNNSRSGGGGGFCCFCNTCMYLFLKRCHGIINTASF